MDKKIKTSQKMAYRQYKDPIDKKKKKLKRCIYI